MIRGFKFKDTEIPDAVTTRSDNPAALGDQSVKYGFPGKTMRDYLDEELTSWDSTDAFTPANLDGAAAGFGANFAERLLYSFVNEPLITVVGDSDKLIADARTGNEVATTSSPAGRQVTGNSANPSSIFVYSALNVMGTVWVDSTTRGGGQNCPAGGILVRNVQIRNNVFDNTYLTGVKAGDHSQYDRLYLMRKQRWQRRSSNTWG